MTQDEELIKFAHVIIKAEGTLLYLFREMHNINLVEMTGSTMEEEQAAGQDQEVEETNEEDTKVERLTWESSDGGLRR